MPTKDVNGKTIEVDDDGYLANPSQWDEDLAKALAKEVEIDELTDQNTLNNERITEMLDRLEIQRQNLLERYIAMETAIASANSILDSIKQTVDQFANSNQ